MTQATAVYLVLTDEWTISPFFNVLSSRLGGDADLLEDDAILRLVEKARAGDRAAGERLYRQHVDRVFRTVRSILRSDMDAEEVTQEAMLTVLISLDRYAPRTGTRFVAWVMTIAVNTARRRFRRKRPEAADPSDLSRIPDDATDLDQDVDRERKRQALLGALAQLDRREREIVSLRYGSELDATEIARMLALEPANVRKILERARTRLAARIEILLGQGV
ncbi:MAG TPA: sigma-70 family RNA polymerase sigma factor [Steroidobacteraceae bacterium]|nr:sigma-70 family RNA polymerase sigma factor [Steroidobacteraceae bacterium]